MKYPDIEQPTARIAILAASLTYLCATYINGAKEITLAKINAKPEVTINGLSIEGHDREMRNMIEELERVKEYNNR